MAETITKGATPANEPDTVFTDRNGRELKFSAAEIEGIREILANPKPPTPELRAAWVKYQQVAANNPDSRW